MLKQLEKEAEEDEEIYEKLACWCETNDKEKTKAIADAEALIEELTSTISELAATSARLSTEIKNLEGEVKEEQDALDQATAMRAKELAEFNEAEKETLLNIQALKNAIIVLSKNHPELMQISDSEASQIAMLISSQMQKNVAVFEGVFTPSQKRLIAAFVQQPTFLQQEPGFGGKTANAGSYAPASGQIFGILKQMKETFETNLSSSQKEEMASQKAYEELKVAKEEEIAAGQAQIDTKTQELADTDEKNAQAKEDVVDTKKSLAADEEFLMMLKEKCSMTDREWEERQKTRSLEMEACSKALAFLTSDDAHDLFTRTFNPAFLQSGAAVKSDRRIRASELLSATARKLESPRLATLAVKVRLDAFERVKKSIDDMVAALLKEKADEIKHKDFCVDEFNKNQLETEKKERQKEDQLAKIEDLEMQIDALNKAINNLKSEISEMQVQMKRAGEDREKENKEFQTTVADQRATAKLLKAALTILQDFYGKKSLLQEPAGPPPPAGFESYKKNQASGGVMGMMQQIIDDAKAMEAEAIRSEEDAQKAYEDFVKETNASIEAKSKDIVNKSEEKAKAESDLVDAQEAKEAVMLELEQLSNYKAQLHSSCDFVTKNFEIRQTARDEEVEALRQAKAILSGAKFEEFLQSS